MKMIKRIIILAQSLFVLSILVVVLLVFVPGTGNDNALGWLDEFSSSQEYFSSNEAYELIMPAVKLWNHDAYVTNMVGLTFENDIGWKLRPDNNMRYWRFVSCSPSANEWVTILLHKGSVGVGVSEKPYGSTDKPCGRPKITSYIDSNVALINAKGFIGTSEVRTIRLTDYDQNSSLDIPYSWLISIHPSDGGVTHVYVDATSGEVIAAYDLEESLINE